MTVMSAVSILSTYALSRTNLGVSSLDLGEWIEPAVVEQYVFVLLGPGAAWIAQDYTAKRCAGPYETESAVLHPCAASADRPVTIHHRGAAVRRNEGAMFPSAVEITAMETVTEDKRINFIAG